VASGAPTASAELTVMGRPMLVVARAARITPIA
jgi:hypothetical protein